MAKYYLDEYGVGTTKKPKKKKKGKTYVLTENGTGREYVEPKDDDIAPVKTTTSTKKNNVDILGAITSGAYLNSIAQSGRIITPEDLEMSRKVAKQTTESNLLNGWFKKSEGNTAETIVGSSTDATKNILSGGISVPEWVYKGAMAIAPAWDMSQKISAGQMMDEEDWEQRRKLQEYSTEVLKKDYYDEDAIAERILKGVASSGHFQTVAQSGGMMTEDDLEKMLEIQTQAENYLQNDMEKHSVFDEKSDELFKSSGQMLATSGLQAVTGGVIPWWAITGMTTLGNETENALKEGATYDEAVASGLISAGAEILSEKLTGGINFGSKTLTGELFDDKISNLLSQAISNKAIRSLAKIGYDATGEGFEEVFSDAVSRVGKKLTYEDEKIWAEILTSEEAMQSYLDSFFGGVFMGSVASGSRAIRTEANGVDFVTENTHNEQKVIDAEVQNRIEAKVKESGRELTSAEKRNIRKQVQTAMERGDISIDTIESVLGGETYEAYKSSTDEINKLKTKITEAQKQLKDVRPAIKNEARQKISELEAKLLESEENFANANLKEKLSSEVEEIAKSDRLYETYAEKYRKGQVFEADLTQYDSKTQETVKRAIDSGILNNTRKTHDFVDLIAKLSAEKGVSFDFTNNEALKNSGFAIEGKTINGLVQGKDVILNIDSSKSLNTVVGHEITHVLEGTELYTELQNMIVEYAKSRGDYDARYKALQGIYKDVKDANIDNELTADLVGDYLFTDESFIRNLSAEKPNIFKKIFEEIKYLYKVATAGSKEARELEKVKRAFEKAYQDTSEANEFSDAETKYSIREEAPPKETGVAYKVFYVKDGKLYPPMVANPDGAETPIGVWLNADVGTSAKPSKTGRPQVKAGGKGTQGGSGSLAFRPGWHLGDLPRASQFDRVNPETGKKELFPENFVWAEVEYAKDVDYQEEAMSYGYTENGKFRHAYAGLPKLPQDGYYRYRTNPKPDTVPWVITGAMKVNRLLSDAEVNAILEENGVAPVHRQGGDVELEKFGFNNDGTVNEGTIDNSVKVMNDGTVVKYSLSTWTPETQEKVRENLVKAGYETEQVDKWIDDTNGVASVIASDKDRLDFEASDNQTMLKNNQEYVKTLDASTLCAKRLVYQGTFNAIQHRMPNTMLTSDDLINLQNMMKEHGVETPCSVCYVESRRRHLGKFAQEWLNGYEGEYKPNLDEVTTSDGLEELRHTHPQTYKDFVDAMNKKGSANPKVVQLRTEYRNEIMSLKPAQIRKIEAIGGLRVQSFSDFETPHLLDMMQAVMDMSAKGLTSQAYTKVPNFAWVFGDTGIKINLSLIAEGDGFDSNGNLAFSSVEGMDINDAMALRDAYSQNVGTIIVGANDKHILACMNDDRIDYIIPFHRSGWGQKELELMNLDSYKDYTYGQNEHDLKTGKNIANLYPPDYWDYNLSGKENAERYLKLCATTGREPKFSEFLVDNGDGSYSLQPDGSTDGYWKTLIDFKMYDNSGKGAEQQKVLPNFNMTEAYRVLNEYEGGANTLPVAEDIVEKFVAKYQSKDIAPTKYSLSKADYGYHAGDLGKAESLSQQGYGRDTGHFGTGTYFVGDEDKINIGGFKERPHEKVDFSKYNLYKVYDSDAGYRLHNFLRGVDGFFDLDEDTIRTEREWERRKDKLEYAIFDEEISEADAIKEAIILFGRYDFGNKFRNMAKPPEGKWIGTDTEGNFYLTDQETYHDEEIPLSDLNKYADVYDVIDHLIYDNRYAPRIISRIEDWDDHLDLNSIILFSKSKKEVLGIINEVKEEIANANYSYEDKKTVDSASTRFMKKLGYEGVDVRGTSLDNTMYGSVIYDLKGEDLARKQEIGTARYSLGDQTAPIGNYNVYGKDIALPSALAPTEQVRDLTKKMDAPTPTISQENINERSEQLHAKLKKKKGVYAEQGTIEDWSYYVYKSASTNKTVVTWWNGEERFNDSHEPTTSTEDALYSVTDFIAKRELGNSEDQFVEADNMIDAPMPEENIPFDDSQDGVTENERPNITNPKELRNADLTAIQTELENDRLLREESYADYNAQIERLQAEFDAKKNQNTKVAQNLLRRIERTKRLRDSVDADYSKRINDLEKREKLVREGKPTTRQALHNGIVGGLKNAFAEKGYDLDAVLEKAKDLSTFATVDNTPQRVMEKALGYKEGQVLSDLTVNKVAQNETEGIKWLNSFTDRRNGLLAQISKQYNIKAGSKESAVAQMYAEGFYVDENNNIIKYGDEELAKDFPNPRVQANIKGLAKDERIRKIYDETLKMINDSRTRNAYPEIPRLDNYFLHFRAMDDTFSRLGLPFNPNDIRAKDLPTDLNGVTADLKPGQPYFASAMHRTGKRTSFDLLGGLERYLTSAKNQIYHIDDIQTLRALRNYIADTYGQAHGLDNIDNMSEEEVEARIKEVYNSHLSTFAKFLNEEANVLAGKTTLIDRGLEGIIGRRGITFLDTVNRQVGSNMVGLNVSSSLTNFLSVAQGFAKTKKSAFVKAFAQTVSNKISSVYGKGDGFAEQSPVMIRRKGADRFNRTLWQKGADAGYVLMSAVDEVSTEIIARAKYNELVKSGMDSQKAHYETDKWVSRLMGDRSLGQQPQLYNSKMLGLFTKFQLEVRNQLDSQFYDTIQEAKVSNEDIQNGLERNARTSAKITSTFVQLAIAQHLFGTAFESVAGYNPALDIIEVLLTAFGFDDEEDSEDTALDNLEQGFLALMEDLPYTSLVLDGGRIPISSALPIGEFITGEDKYGNEKSRLETLKEIAPYYLLPTGYGQIKKTAQGLGMFDDDLPTSGSYTKSGNLRFPVEDTLENRIQAGIFGQYANENARNYFDNERNPLKEKQIQEYIDLDLPIADYWQYREGLSEQKTLEDKFDYIADLDVSVEQKNIMINNVVDRKEKVDMSNYDDFANYEEFDFYAKNTEKYNFLQAYGISYDEYKSSKDAKEEYDEIYSWYKNNPEKVTLSQSLTDNVIEYRRWTGYLNDIRADKDADGDSISGSAKAKKIAYINSLDLDYGQKLIFIRSLYDSNKDKEAYDGQIIDYLNNRSDISYEEMVTILGELGMKVHSDGSITY